ncbi:hypothetical protein DRP53_10070 [candidate division WOR-3 bacterium]|uniref:PTS EIIB type-4 domain-containing protein n=1 Tax=candidate division WOR-3 bacterium TaxID=2052148 RepID=A0A660SD85_UNCW3|nr:MAG: hypothetical protein DRP53_10070 [candidate division WOR-3 bacterium]
MFILRVDDRLIHGQVIAGWVRPLGIERLILSSDAIAPDEWLRKAYTLAVPDDISLAILTLDETIRSLGKGHPEKLMVVVESVADAKYLIDNGLGVEDLNLGCIGYREGRMEITPYIYLDADEMKLLVQIGRNGIKVEARALPNSPPVDVLAVIRSRQ